MKRSNDMVELVVTSARVNDRKQMLKQKQLLKQKQKFPLFSMIMARRWPVLFVLVACGCILARNQNLASEGMTFKTALSASAAVDDAAADSYPYTTGSTSGAHAHNHTHAHAHAHARTAVTDSYDPRNCTHIQDGTCKDDTGGAWTYKTTEGNCVYSEQQVPRDTNAANLLPSLFPGSKAILDFGGGVGAFLTPFRDAGLNTLVTVEPQPLGDCLFRGITQDTTDWVNAPLSQLPKDQYDVVMTIEVAEHIPVHFHKHLIQALAQATKKYIVFSAAHPGQAGSGHVGPSMKSIQTWIQQANDWASLTVDHTLTQRLHNVSSRMLRRNCVIFFK